MPFFGSEIGGGVAVDFALQRVYGGYMDLVFHAEVGIFNDLKGRCEPAQKRVVGEEPFGGFLNWGFGLCVPRMASGGANGVICRAVQRFCKVLCKSVIAEIAPFLSNGVLKIDIVCSSVAI